MRYGTFLGGALLGAALVGVAWLTVGAGSAPPTAPSLAERGGSEEHWAEVVARLERIEGRLQALPAAAASVRGDGPHLQGRPPEDPPIGTAAVAVDPEALADAIERAEERREERLSTEELTALARNRMYMEKDYLAARRTLERLLERDLEPEARVEALTNLGIAHRSAGDHEASLEVLERALEISGVDEEKGAWAAFQVMWTHSFKGDRREATAWGERIVRAKHESLQVRVSTHRALGIFARDDGDLEKARRELQTAVDLAADDPTYTNYRKSIQQLLDGLE